MQTLLEALEANTLGHKLEMQIKASLDSEQMNEATNKKGDYWVLNRSGISTNRKMLKLAQMGGVKHNGEWWFVSARRVSKEKSDEMYSNVKNNPDFALVKTDDIQLFNSNYCVIDNIVDTYATYGFD